MDWKTISADEARQVRYYGFGGWLLTFYVAVIVYLLLWVPAFFLGAPPGWNRFLFYTNIVMTEILWLPFFILSPMKKSIMPKLTIVLMWLSIVATWVIGFVGAEGAMLPMMVIGVLFAALMTWYFRSSKRVNVTYRHRIKA